MLLKEKSKVYKGCLHSVNMTDYIFLRCRLSTWKAFRKDFYGRKNESFSDYLERLRKELIEMKQWKK